MLLFSMINTNKQTEGLKMLNDTLNGMIELIYCFEDCNKFFWIDKLSICKADKGFLILYFNLV